MNEELEQSYKERIAHLRTALEFAGEDINFFRKQFGLPPQEVTDFTLAQDTKRSIEQDNL